MALCARALELYSGGFLPGDEDTAWVVSPREQWRNKFLRIVNEVGNWLEKQGRVDEAVDLYFRGLEADELAEGLYRRLMLCFQQQERKAEAIEIYNRCCRTLASSLDIEPSRETRDIYDSLVHAA